MGDNVQVIGSLTTEKDAREFGFQFIVYTFRNVRSSKPKLVTQFSDGLNL